MNNHSPVSSVKIKSFVSYAIHTDSNDLLYKWMMGSAAVDNHDFFILRDNSGNEIMKKPISELDCKTDMTVNTGGFLIIDGDKEVHITFPTKFLYNPVSYKQWCEALQVSDSTAYKTLNSTVLVVELVSIAILLIAMFYAVSLF